MPPEPPSLDRKESLREKKQERAADAAPAPSCARWRDPRRLSSSASNDPRPSPGPCKQGGYQGSSEESGQGCTTSSKSGSDGRNGRTGSGGRAENNGSWSVGHKQRNHAHQHHPWEGGRQQQQQQKSDAAAAAAVGQRSVDDLLVPQTSSHVENSPWDDFNLEDQHDKFGGVNGLGTGQACEREPQPLGPITWKALKWSRPGGLSSRASGLGHSSGSKGSGADPQEARVEVVGGREAVARSPSADASEGVGVASPAPAEGGSARKKPRLGWGDGLAKYEKEKVEGPDVQCTVDAKGVSNAGALSLPDKSPKFGSASECTSPATPCSVTCSSSSGQEERIQGKATSSDNGMNHFHNSPGQGFHKCSEELSANMEHLELNPISNISSLLLELLPSQESGYGDSDFVQFTSLNKLLLLKADILKLLEKTEGEIDMFENELKFLDWKPETDAPCPNAPESVQAALMASQEQVEHAANVSKKEQLPSLDPLEVVAEVNDEDIDSPGTVTSKRSELSPMEYQASPSDRIKMVDHVVDMDASQSSVQRDQCCVSPAALEGENRTLSDKHNAHAHVLTSVSTYGGADSSLYDLILASNKELARQALEVFDRALPSNLHHFDIQGTFNSLSCGKSNLWNKKRLVMCQRLKNFKERVLTLKFRALHHLWKDDLRLLSLKKNRAKSQKRFDSSFRYLYSGYQKHRTSMRSRFTSPGESTLVPTTETLDFTGSKLLSDSQIKRYRDVLKMPALVLDDQRHSRFITSNGLVEDPCAVERERSMMNPWLPDEKEVFMEKLAAFGKDFAKIASFLRHKTTADCIEFYYKNHKSESFEKVKKKLEPRKQLTGCLTNTYLVTSGKKWNRDANVASLDILGAASAAALHAGDSKVGQLYPGLPLAEKDVVLERTSSVEIPGNESEAAAADVLASICGGMSSEAMSSCITSSIDLGEGCQEWRGQKVKSMALDRPFTPEVSQNIDEDTFSDDSCGELGSADWTDEEKALFIMALRTYGKDFANISKFVRTRSRDQCKAFFSKARKCLGLDLIHREPDNEATRMSDASSGRSDTEDACVLEIDSAICSMQSCSKIDEDLPLSMVNRCGKLDNAENEPLWVELDGASKKAMVSGPKPELESGMKELDSGVDHSVTKRSCVFDGEKESFKEEVQVNRVSEVTQMDGATAVEAVAGPSNLCVRLLDDTDSFVDIDKKVQGIDQARPFVQLNSVCTEIPLDLGQFSSHDLVKSREEDGVQHEPYFGVEHDQSIEQELKPGCSVEVPQPRSEPLQLVVPETALDSDWDATRIPRWGTDSKSCGTSSRDPPDSVADKNEPCQEVELDERPTITSALDHQLHTSQDTVPSTQESQVISWPQKENLPHCVTNSSTLGHYDSICQAMQSLPTFEELKNKQHQIVDSVALYQQYLPLQVLRGYPLQLLNNKDISKRADLINEKLVEKLPKTDSDCRSSPSYVLEKCDDSKSPVSVAELSLLSKSEHPEDTLRSGSKGLEKQATGSCDTPEEQSVRTGDVKLFGQILSQLSPMQRVSSPSDKNDKAASPNSSQSFSFKFSEQGPHGALTAVTLDANNYLCRQEFPVTSFGVWDGNNRLQNGHPLLSGSALLSAPNNFSVPASQVDSRPPSASLRRNDVVLGRVLRYPTKDAGGNGVLDNHHMFHSYEGPNMKPFSLDVKRQDHNGFETLLGFQQQGTAIVGMSGVGGGIVVGGLTGVSDPVVALKQHFANEVRSTGLIREDESWNRDVSRQEKK